MNNQILPGITFNDALRSNAQSQYYGKPISQTNIPGNNRLIKNTF